MIEDFLNHYEFLLERIDSVECKPYIINAEGLPYTMYEATIVLSDGKKIVLTVKKPISKEIIEERRNEKIESIKRNLRNIKEITKEEVKKYLEDIEEMRSEMSERGLEMSDVELLQQIPKIKIVDSEIKKIQAAGIEEYFSDLEKAKKIVEKNKELVKKYYEELREEVKAEKEDYSKKVEKIVEECEVEIEKYKEAGLLGSVDAIRNYESKLRELLLKKYGYEIGDDAFDIVFDILDGIEKSIKKR